MTLDLRSYTQERCLESTPDSSPHFFIHPLVLYIGECLFRGGPALRMREVDGWIVVQSRRGHQLPIRSIRCMPARTGCCTMTRVLLSYIPPDASIHATCLLLIARPDAHTSKWAGRI